MQPLYFYLLFDIVLWCVVLPLLWYSTIYADHRYVVSHLYTLTLFLITLWHFGLLIFRYILLKLQPFLLPMWLEIMSVCMGIIMMLFAIHMNCRGYYLLSSVPFLVGLAIVVAHGRRIYNPRVNCYYYCI